MYDAAPIDPGTDTLTDTASSIDISIYVMSCLRREGVPAFGWADVDENATKASATTNRLPRGLAPC